MDENLKIVPFKWELGEEKVSLHIGEYQYGDRLYIGITSHGEDGPEPFADMTVNLKCTPFVRQYDILNNKWGDFLCQKE